MADTERLVRFTLLGQEFSFYTGASEEEMEKILSLVRKLVDESVSNAQSVGTIPVGKTAIMACLNLASRYLELEREFAEYKKENQAKVCSLVDKIDACLLSEKRDRNG